MLCLCGFELYSRWVPLVLTGSGSAIFYRLQIQKTINVFLNLVFCLVYKVSYLRSNTGLGNNYESFLPRVKEYCAIIERDYSTTSTKPKAQ